MTSGRERNKEFVQRKTIVKPLDQNTSFRAIEGVEFGRFPLVGSGRPERSGSGHLISSKRSS